MTNKTVLVTGGSRGIGAAIVKAATDKGYRVAFTYNVNSKRAVEVEKASAGMAFAVQCDVSSPESVLKMTKEVKKRLGHIDMLVNNAGICKSQLFQDVTDEDWRKMFAVNVDGAFYVTRAVVEEMIFRQSGSIVNVSSMWGRVGASMEVAYSSSKAALIGMTKALAKELAPSHVTVNAVAPGAVDTDMMKGYTEEELSALCEEIPLGRLASPTEIASAVLYMLEAPYVTGQVLGVDGGYVI